MLRYQLNIYSDHHLLMVVTIRYLMYQEGRYKTMKTIEINGKIFEACKGTLNTEPYINQSDIHDVYGRPSDTKCSIYHRWADWFISHRSVNFGICSHNCNFFSMEGIIIDENTNKKYYVHITKCHPTAIEIL